MDNLVPEYYKRYGIYVNTKRMFPLDIDGCRPVERRVLLSTFESARSKLTKCARIDGHCIGHYHPHGSCITGDTEILLSNGEKKSIRELTNKKELFYVYSCTTGGSIVPGEAHSARLMKEVFEICEVVLDNGEILCCTPDHLIMLRDGSYEKAENLKSDQSIMSVNLLYNNGYPFYRDVIKVSEIRIKKLNTSIQVFDLTVEKYNNFAVSQGIFIHNSYGTLVQMVNNGFLDGQGNFGSSCGVEETPPAAMRYTECKLSDLTYNLMFRYIDYVPKVDSEMDPEPEFLPTMFPICLLGKRFTEGIGWAYKTSIPCYELKDLYKRLLFLLGKENTEPVIKPYSDCTVLSGTKELRDLLNTGKGKIKFRGRMKVDNIKHKVILYSWPYPKKFETIWSKFQKESENGDIGFVDVSADSKTCIEIEVLKQRSKKEILDNLVKKLTEVITSDVSFDTIVVDSKLGIIKSESIDNLLLKTFNNYESVTNIMLTNEIQRLQESLNEYIVLKKIRPFLGDILKKKELEDIEKEIQDLSTKTNTDLDIIKKLLSKHRIQKLLTIEIDESDIQNQMSKVKSNLKNIRDFVLDDLKEVISNG